jgi:nitrite reductase/ring-hydroxylating ferredoxin subunit
MTQVAKGSLFSFIHGDVKILLANLNGKILATDLICTHAEADLSKGKIIDNGVKCPLHRSVFDLNTGKPREPPADTALRTYNVKIENNEIFVEV